MRHKHPSWPFMGVLVASQTKVAAQKAEKSKVPADGVPLLRLLEPRKLL